MYLCYHPSYTAWLEASVDSGLVIGSTVDGLCLAVATMAVATGDGGPELLPYSSASSPAEWLRQGYV